MKKRLIDFSQPQMTDAAKVFHSEIIKTKAYDSAKIDLAKDNEAIQESITRIEDLAYTLTNGGIDPATGRYMAPADIQLAITAMSDSGVGSTSVITQTIITRAVQMIPEPDSIWQAFTKVVSYVPGTQVITPYIGAAHATTMIGQAGEYPIISVDKDQETIASTNKYGVAIQFPEETIKYANYDIITLYMTKAVEDMSRFKNMEAINKLMSKATVLYDNLDPTNSVLGETTGRSLIDGKENKTFVIRDLFKAVMHGITKGVYYDTMLLSTFGYMVFMNDPTLRDFVRANGGPIFKLPSGQIGANREFSRGANAANGTGSSNSLTYNMPTEFTNMNFKFIVTPFMPTYQKGDTVYRTFPFENVAAMPYLQTAGVDAGKPVVCGNDMMTDIVLIDSSNALICLQEEGITTDRIEDKLIDTTKIKFKERYKFVITERGRGIGIIKNVVITEDTFDYYNTQRPTVTEAREALKQ